jgi:hypothetical protein
MRSFRDGGIWFLELPFRNYFQWQASQQAHLSRILIIRMSRHNCLKIEMNITKYEGNIIVAKMI